MRLQLVALGAVVALACAGAPSVSPGKAAAWGFVKLVPRAGTESPSSSTAYGDRRLREAPRVDYSRPGFAVVFVEADVPRSAGPSTELALRPGVVGVRLVPQHAAVAVGDPLVAVNRTDARRILSCPSTGMLKQIEPGESFEFELTVAGEHTFHLLGADAVSATFFAAPGPFSVVSPAGRYELRDLEPGRALLRSWHPRLPPAAQWVDLAAGEVVRQDMEMGVGLGTGVRETDEKEISRASH